LPDFSAYLMVVKKVVELDRKP